MKQTLTYIILLTVYSASGQISLADFYFDKTNEVSYKSHLVFQYGGESKLTILPKFNFYRIHQQRLLKPYYGIEIGVHPLFVAGAFTFSALTGCEIKNFQLETSLTHFRTTSIAGADGGQKGPYMQNLFNFKIGYIINRISIKIGTSFTINENISKGEERLPLFDLGMINNHIYGVEFQYRMN